MPFKIIKKQYVSDLVFEQLRNNIYSGVLKAGDKIISEHDLAEIMQVSPSCVKKAITQLIEMGYVEHRKGLGNFIKIPGSEDPHNPFAYIMTPRKSSLDELMEVRIGLECHGAVLAADRANEQDISFLEQALSELTENQPCRGKARDADIKFHMGIAYATHNSVHIDLMKRFHDYLFHSINKLQSLLYEKHNNLEDINKQHLKIFEAITSGDTECARQYMLQHITFLRGFLQGGSGN